MCWSQLYSVYDNKDVYSSISLALILVAKRVFIKSAVAAKDRASEQRYFVILTYIFVAVYSPH